MMSLKPRLVLALVLVVPLVLALQLATSCARSAIVIQESDCDSKCAKSASLGSGVNFDSREEEEEEEGKRKEKEKEEKTRARMGRRKKDKYEPKWKPTAEWERFRGRHELDSKRGKREDKQVEEEENEFIKVAPDVQTHLTAQRLTNRSELLNQKLPNRRPLDNVMQVASSLGPTPEGASRRRQEPRDHNDNIEQPSSMLSQKRLPKVFHQNSPAQQTNYPQLSAQRQKLTMITNTQQQQQSISNSPTASPQYDYINRLHLDSNIPLDVQAHIGNTAYLVCRLRSMHQQDHLRVSWVRNMQILTSGEFRYTSDERFQASHIAGTHDWMLEIHNVNANDEGPYECQVNSEPKPATVTLYLHVIAASVEILEARQLQLAEDDQIRLTCRVNFSSQAQLNAAATDETSMTEEQPETTPTPLVRAAGQAMSRPLSSQHYIYWYKDKVSLEYNNPRGGIRVERRQINGNLESVLSIEGAKGADSGIYMCKILPELYDVQPAQAQVIIGADSGSNGATSKLSSLLVCWLTNTLFALLLLSPGHLFN